MLVFSGSSRPEKKDTEYLTTTDLTELHRTLEEKFEKNIPEDEDPVVSDFGLKNAAERPGASIFGKDAYPSFAEKAAALFYAILQNKPFRNSNERLAIAALWAFCELNGRKVNTRYLGDKTLQKLITAVRKGKEPPEKLFATIRSTLESAIQ